MTTINITDKQAAELASRYGRSAEDFTRLNGMTHEEAANSLALDLASLREQIKSAAPKKKASRKR